MTTKIGNPKELNALRDRALADMKLRSAQKRMEGAKTGEYECLDWWLCHKKLS